MLKKMKKYLKFIVCCVLMLSLMAPSYAALSASDGSAFVTKAEFDSALADFNARLTTFEAGINSKIDSQVTSYLDRNGIWSGKEQLMIGGSNWYYKDLIKDDKNDKNLFYMLYYKHNTNYDYYLSEEFWHDYHWQIIEKTNKSGLLLANYLLSTTGASGSTLYPSYDGNTYVGKYPQAAFFTYGSSGSNASLGAPCMQVAWWLGYGFSTIPAKKPDNKNAYNVRCLDMGSALLEGTKFVKCFGTLTQVDTALFFVDKDTPVYFNSWSFSYRGGETSRIAMSSNQNTFSWSAQCSQVVHLSFPDGIKIY